VQLPYEVQEEQDALPFLALLQETALFLWKDWPKNMEVVLYSNQANTFTMRGTCPHCRHDSAFLTVTSLHVDHKQSPARFITGMQCQACARYILAVAIQANTATLVYEAHYPLGKPDDAVANEIPDHIKPDFREALRCLWVDAYNATAEMCRRALEASCIDLKAPKNLKVLEDKIDWLADNRVITPTLQQSAHKIRLGGNRGAHPPEDGPVDPNAPSTLQDEPVVIIEKDHALAIVEFTRHFFQYVYVIPKQLEKYDFSKPKVVKP
jgi:hypothetical protein